MIHMHRLVSGSTLIAAGLVIAVLSASNATLANMEEVVYSFAGGSDGANPYGKLITDGQGNFYGTTAGGGGGTGCGSGTQGCGTIFKLTDGQESVLYAFAGGTDGFYPRKGLFLDDEGNLYGVTSDGGDSDMGTAFKLAPDGTKTTLHSFTGGSDGGDPNSDLVADAEGNLYGTAVSGGVTGVNGCSHGCGTIYKITPAGQFSVLYAFQGGATGDGARPSGGLVAGAQGNFYGATYNGGNRPCSGGGCGTIFQITPEGEVGVLYAFLGGSDGESPNADLIIDAAGNLYGTTTGGSRRGRGGTVFKVSAEGVHTVLYSFRGGDDARYPSSGLVADAVGNLYGTTPLGGDKNFGTVFKVTPDGEETVLHSFQGGSDGWDPRDALVIDSAGILYGTTDLGGANGKGTVFTVQSSP
jgi:uncharacterized repeat protein (TIGR03803 family)